MNDLPALPKQIRVVEVGLRDGLQAVYDPVLSTETKIEAVRLLIDAGVGEIEAVSFAHPAVLPQLADAAEVMAGVPRTAGVRYRGLVPNLKGARRAVETGLNEIAVVVSADEGVSLRNQNRTTDQMLVELAEIGPLVRDSGADLVVGIACAFFARSLRRSSVSSGRVTRMTLPSFDGLAPRFGMSRMADSMSRSAPLS